MKRPAASLILLLATVAATASLPSVALAQGSIVALVPHRAVYDLKLASTRGKRPMEAVRGRILYDFTGSACEGYALQFRQVSELDAGDGKVATSDLRATSWEEGAAKRLRFHSQNFMDENLRETVDGQAERLQDGSVAVKLTEPEAKGLDFKPDVVFPTEHVRRIIEAARAGKTLLQLAVYDGSDNGQKFYDSLSVIGRPIGPGEGALSDAAAGQEALSKLTRWPVTISYFDHSVSENSGEQTPVYAITFELYENGVSRGLLLDYGDFVLSGQMTSFEIKSSKPCP